MRLFKKVIILMTFLVSVLFIKSTPIFAAENPGGFTVNAIHPSNQITENSASYYDLLVKPNQKQTIKFSLLNSTDDPSTFEVWVNPAMTTDGGAIDYSQRNAKVDKTVPFDFQKAVTVEKHDYKVPAQSTIEIPVNIALPNKVFNGRVIGGINVVKKGKGSTNATNNSGAVINTKVGYSLAIVLQQNKNKVTPEINYLSTKPKAVNSYASIQMAFRNPSATIIPDLIFTTKIKKDGQKYIENTSNKYSVAPNTKFHVNLGLDDQKIQPGKYSVDIVAKSGVFYKWHFKDTFEIKPEIAEEVNKNSIFKTNEGINIWLVLSIVFAVILVALLIFLLWKRKKNDDQEA